MKKLISVFIMISLLFVFGCGGGEEKKKVVSEKSSTISAEKGGKIETEDGTSIEIPSGALDSDTEITMTVYETSGYPAKKALKSRVVQFEPSGTIFKKPIIITVTASENINGLIAAAVLDEKTNTWHYNKDGVAVTISDSKDEMGDPIMMTAGGDPIMLNAGGDPIMQNAMGDPIMLSAAGDPIMISAMGDPIMGAAMGDPIMMTTGHFSTFTVVGVKEAEDAAKEDSGKTSTNKDCEAIFDCIFDCIEHHTNGEVYEEDCEQACYENSSEKGQSDYMKFNQCAYEKCEHADDNNYNEYDYDGYLDCIFSGCKSQAKTCGVSRKDFDDLFAAEQCEATFYCFFENCWGENDTEECRNSCKEHYSAASQKLFNEGYQCGVKNCKVDKSEAPECLWNNCSKYFEACYMNADDLSYYISGEEYSDGGPSEDIVQGCHDIYECVFPGCIKTVEYDEETEKEIDEECFQNCYSSENYDSLMYFSNLLSCASSYCNRDASFEFNDECLRINCPEDLRSCGFEPVSVGEHDTCADGIACVRACAEPCEDEECASECVDNAEETCFSDILDGVEYYAAYDMLSCYLDYCISADKVEECLSEECASQLETCHYTL
ncbi:hypothetical protein J6Z39_04595 [bacterium]|nr:hypothetical protein [bacterium]